MLSGSAKPPGTALFAIADLENLGPLMGRTAGSLWGSVPFCDNNKIDTRVCEGI